jgi:murein DD-endopeptidase MepM/ murein hydrolase activator NlpD
MHEAIIIGSGMVGGKSSGYFKAKSYLEREDVKRSAPDLVRTIRFPRTVCVTTDVFAAFVKENNLGPLIQQQKWNEETAYEVLRGHFLFGKFSEPLRDAFRNVLKEMDYPLAVRSSSMLEDKAGTSFAGKYETIFISNKGSDDERLEQLCRAIKEIYASTYNPSALQYRKKHKLLEEDEQMAILLQQAIGREYKSYFLPLMAGVGFSQNGYLWNKEIQKQDGIVRLVFGLGTRAVGRGYARIFSPGMPLARPEGTDAKAITKFSQQVVDVLDLKSNTLKQIRFSELVKDGFKCYPRAQRLFSLKDENYLYIPPTNMWNKNHQSVLTFDGILASPWLGLDMPKLTKWMFGELETSFSCPVDIEFAVRVDDDPEEAHFYLVQCRPLSQRERLKPRAIPKVSDDKKIFLANKLVPTARLKKIEYIIYVDSVRYKTWPANDKYAIARVVGKLNQILEDKNFILMGPGRWGSVNPELGVAVKYSEISNTKMLVEVSIRDADYLPEVSYGTHFFQDLIEDDIIYVPLYPDEEGCLLNKDFFEKGNVFRKLLENEYYAKYEDLIKVISVPEVTGGKFAAAVFNGEKEQGLVYVK